MLTAAMTCGRTACKPASIAARPTLKAPSHSNPAGWPLQAASLALSDNKLSGAAFRPSWIERGMPSLEYLHLSNNTELTGTLPAELPWPVLSSM